MSVFMYPCSCIRTHVSVFMYPYSCNRIRVTLFMYKSSRICVHVSVFMYPCACILYLCTTQRGISPIDVSVHVSVLNQFFPNLAQIYRCKRLRVQDGTLPFPGKPVPEHLDACTRVSLGLTVEYDQFSKVIWHSTPFYRTIPQERHPSACTKRSWIGKTWLKKHRQAKLHTETIFTNLYMCSETSSQACTRVNFDPSCRPLLEHSAPRPQPPCRYN